MELIINSPSADGFIKAIDWNYEEIKSELEDKVAMYGCMVYDDTQIKEAKADRAELNKFKKALDDKRKEIKQQCLAPYDKFEKQMKEIMAIIDEPVKVIDAQVKAFEEQQKQQKQEEIKAYFETKDMHGFTYESIEDPKWLNAGTSMKSIKEAIDTKAEEIAADFELLNALEEYTFEAVETYKKCGDVRAALAEAKRLTDMAKQKAEWEARKAEEAAKRAEEATRQEDEPAAEPPAQKTEPEPAEEPEVLPFQAEAEDFIPDFDSIPNNRTWVAIKAFMTPEDKEAAEWFLNSRGIPFEILGE